MREVFFNLILIENFMKQDLFELASNFGIKFLKQQQNNFIMFKESKEINLDQTLQKISLKQEKTKQKPSKTMKVGKMLENFLEQVFPGVKRKSNIINFPKNFLSENRKILNCNFQAGIETFRGRTEMFFIYVGNEMIEKQFEKQKSPVAEKHLATLKQVANSFFVIFLKRCSKNRKFTKIFEQQGVLTNQSALLACRLNNCDELIVIGDLFLQSSLDKEKLKLKIQQIIKNHRSCIENEKKFGSKSKLSNGSSKTTLKLQQKIFPFQDYILYI